ncbi:flagellar basal-body rod protein FlgC [Shewanella sp. NFH-SH190041]|uniref:flagellar basal body rod protein FlgC n=1 Tax=Shewanella sp. NFH-SH190041 TaxID=2950245 RepID=UPI0021C2F794|nr:flagellar basal body rod protein FlgC [Shewanella sp. NFH-SH190041]BDM62722.1 flagellar basal-body rod protein FlgC [Shewanella sp. NFH-SH190041]
MSFNQIYDIAGSAMTAHTIRLNTIASNLANAGVAAKSPDKAYRALEPVFETIYSQTGNGQVGGAKVRVASIVKSNAPIEMRYQPDHPLANKDGYVAYSNVNTVEEMADMMDASRAFESNVDVINRARSMQQGLLSLGTR